MKTTEEKSAIEIADHVKHMQSGEEWMVARVNDLYVWPCGWPESRALKSDCVLIEKSSTEFVSPLPATSS